MSQSVRENYQRIKQRIEQACARFQRNPADVDLLAVSKGQSLHKIHDLYAEGQRHFGENYLQEALDKVHACQDLQIDWHFIGRIQRNKTRLLSQHVSWVHSLSRINIAERLNASRSDTQAPLNVCIQVNLTGSPTKDGCDAKTAIQLAHHIQQLPRLRLRGLMAVPDPMDNFEAQCEQFLPVKQLFLQLNQDLMPLDTLSLGMSADLEAAIACGSTLVRIGTALFGPRLID